MTTPTPPAPDDQPWKSEEHDPACESRLFGRCDCSKYIVLDVARKFGADLKRILHPAGDA